MPEVPTMTILSTKERKGLNNILGKVKSWVAGRVQTIPDLFLFPTADFGMEMAPWVKHGGRKAGA